MAFEQSTETAISNLESAYAGRMGQARAEFCIRFIERKQESLRRIHDDIFAQITREGSQTTCHKDCPACCVLYIEANVQECEAIVYYLYQHPVKLSLFLEHYAAWRRTMRELGDPFRLCEEVLHRDGDDALSRSDRDALFGALREYQRQDIPCCFLDGGACSIYEVRPYVCANHLVTTPAEWCRASNWCNPDFPDRPEIYMTSIDEIDDVSFYHDVLPRPVIGFLPTTVYRILNGGMDYVAALTGLPSLRPDTMSGDSAIRGVTG